MVRTRWLAAGAAATVLVAVGCKVDVGREDMPRRLTAMFDPTSNVVPMPNDLARGVDGRIATTVAAKDAQGKDVVASTQSPVMKAFIEDYLNAMPDGYPQAIGLTVPFQPSPDQPIDPATLAGDAVRVFDITDLAKPVEVKPLSYGKVEEYTTYGQVVEATATTERQVVKPGVTVWQVAVSAPVPWTPGHRYAAFLTTKVRSKPAACPAGVADCSSPVVAPITFSFLKSRTPLVSDKGAALIFATDDQAENDALAKQLEAVRQLLKPVLDAFDVEVPATCDGGDDCCPAATDLKVPRCRTALAWTFGVSKGNEALFDPTAGIVPFPNDILIDQKTGLVNLPISESEPAMNQALKKALNTLDGFSTMGAATQRFSLELDPDTLKRVAEFKEFVPNGPGIAVVDITKVDPKNAATVAELTKTENWWGADRLDAKYEGGQLVLTPLPGHPFPPGHRFLVALMAGLKTKGDAATPIHVSPVFRIIKSKDALFQAGQVLGGKATCAAVADCEAGFACLEGACLKSAMPGTLTEANAVLLEQLRQAYLPLFDALEQLRGIARPQVVGLFTFTTLRTYPELEDLAKALPAPTDGSCTFVDAATSNLLKNAPRDHVGQVCDSGKLKIKALLQAPDVTNPAAPRPGYFAVGEDGMPAFREVELPFVMTVPKNPPAGMPVVLFAHGLYGQKEDLAKIADDLATAGIAAIAVDAPFHGAHPIRLPGTDSGTMFFTADPFSVRDNLREANLEHRQVASFVLQNLKAKLGIDVGTKLGYVGVSLGGILGTGTAVVVPEIDRVALVVPAGHMIRILLETANKGFSQPLFDALAAAGLKPGSAELLQFLTSAQWALDRADPVNLAQSPAAKPGAARYLVVEARNDEFLPNTATAELSAVLQTEAHAFPAEATGTMCHGFFMDGCDMAELSTEYPGRFPDLTAEKAKTAQAEARTLVVDFLKQ